MDKYRTREAEAERYRDSDFVDFMQCSFDPILIDNPWTTSDNPWTTLDNLGQPRTTLGQPWRLRLTQ